MSETFKVASNFKGDKLYQQRARVILPILVRQAIAREPLSYQALADEVSMPNPRNLNYPLGCIGDALNELSKQWDEEIPHIQALVCTQRDDLPGDGFYGFLKDQGYSWKTSEERKSVIELYWKKIQKYRYWDDVLDALGLLPVQNDLNKVIKRSGKGRGGGEGPEHKALKEYIAANPEEIKLSASMGLGVCEYSLPSGDKLDILFENKRKIYGIEVKPEAAPEHDIARGMFQCVKYQSVLKAKANFKQDKRSIFVLLVLGGSLPKSLIPLRNSLGIKVFSDISYK